MLTQTNCDWQSACCLARVTYPRNGTWLPELAPTSPSLNVDRAIKTSTYGDPARNIRSRTFHFEISSSSLKFQVSAWNFKFQLKNLTGWHDNINFIWYHMAKISEVLWNHTQNPCILPVISEVPWYFLQFHRKCVNIFWYCIWYHIWYHCKKG